MFDIFATPERREWKRALEARLATDPEALLKDCQAEWERAETSVRACFSEASEQLDGIRETVGEIAFCFRSLSADLPVPQSLFHASPDEKALSDVAHAVSTLQKMQQKLRGSVHFLQKTLSLQREYGQQMRFWVTVCATASDAACGSAYEAAFSRLCSAAEALSARCTQRIADLSALSILLMRFSEETLPKHRNDLLAAADFAEKGRAGDLRLLRRRAGEIAFSVGEFQAKIPHLDDPFEVS